MMENSKEKKRREKMTRKKRQFRRMVYRSREGKRGSRRVLLAPALLACGQCDEGRGGRGGLAFPVCFGKGKIMPRSKMSMEPSSYKPSFALPLPDEEKPGVATGVGSGWRAFAFLLGEARQQHGTVVVF
ncbi:unnamed protein product [Calypogeia fissa]